LKTVSKEYELDALPKGTRIRFTISKAIATKTIGNLWMVAGSPGVYMPGDLCMNGTLMEVLDE
jgi:hypothetical protein